MTDSSISCYHCGLPVLDDRFRTEINGESQPMCCPGCKAAAEAIASCGLDQYYQFRTELNENPERDDQPNRFDLYDRDDVQQDFVFTDSQDQPEFKQLKVFIEGITCAACVWLLEKRLSQLSGVESAVVNLSTHSAQIRFNNENLKISEIFISIEALGYQPRPYRKDKQQDLLDKTRRDFLLRIGIAGIGMMQVMMNATAIYVGDIEWRYEILLRWASMILTLPVILYSAQPFFKAAIRDLKTRHLSMDVPVSLAIVCAFLASLWATINQTGEIFFESVTMFTFFLLVGRFLEFQARQRAHQSNESLHDILPVTVTRLTKSGIADSTIKSNNKSTEEVTMNEVVVGDVLQILPGQTIPADGVVSAGTSSVNESSLTGEFSPVPKQAGSLVRAGSINTDGLLNIKISALGAESSLSTMIRLLDRSAAEKPAIVAIADRVASYFVFAVLFLTLATYTFWFFHEPDQAFWIALSVLVVTCPCALSLATPVALATATTSLKSIGVLPTRGYAISALARATDAVFDKTGTLTNGHFDFTDAQENQAPKEHLILAASLQQFSEHPIARAFTHSIPKPHRLTVEQAKVVQGKGVEGIISGDIYRIGSAEFCHPELVKPGDGLWVALFNVSNQQLVQWFELQDLVRTDAREALGRLSELSIKSHMLTGDRSIKAKETAQLLNLNSYQSGQTPDQKVAQVTELQNQGARVLMLGDGINDAPVLAKADVSVAMANGTELAKHSSDVLLLNNHLNRIPAAIQLARKTYRIIKQNLAWALIYNLLALPLAMAGLIAPWMAAIGMSLSSLLVVVNALRLNKKAL